MMPYVPDKLPLDGIDWGSLMRLVVQANAGIARYDGLLQTIPNPEILLSQMSTQEAVISSRIEGTQADLREVLEYQAVPNGAGKGAEGRKWDDLREVENYWRAMNEAMERLEKKPLSLNSIRDIHWTLMDSVRGHNMGRGKFRREQNHIGKPGSGIEDARYVPPSHETIMQHLDNFERYIHYDEEDRIVQLAILHGQFEVIHPFLDGNGRVGRILIPLFLYEKELLSSPSFYLSEYLEANDTAYRDGLLAITEEGDWLGWIRFFLKAVNEQATANSRKALRILDMYDEMKQKVTESTRSRYAIQILDTMFSVPLFTSSGFASLTNIPNRTATRVINKLVDDQVLQVALRGSGQLPTIFVFNWLIDEVESRAFAH